MTDEGKGLKLELDELKKLTEELREIKDNNDEGTCSECKRFAAIAYRTAERYYEILIRAEIIEATWYKKGWVDCEKIDCECKRENEILKNKIEDAQDQLSRILNSPFTSKDE